MQSDFERLSIGKAAKLLNVSIDTLRRWENRGKISSYRSPGGHRYFLKDELKTLFGKKYYRLKRVAEVKEPELQEVISQPFDFPEDVPSFIETPSEMDMVKSEEPAEVLPDIPGMGEKEIQKTGLSRIFIIFLAFFAAINVILIPFYFFLSRQ